MPRKDRIVIPDVPHHITHRGNNKQTLFIDNPDRLLYLDILKDRSEKYKLKIHGYCLMTNHVHLAATPTDFCSLEKAIGLTDQMFARYSNLRHCRTGHLWEHRFNSYPLDEGHFLNALTYIDRNPVRAGIVANPLDYSWSSARAHVSMNDFARLVSMEDWVKIAEAYNWKEIVQHELAATVVDEIEYCLLSGSPCFGTQFRAINKTVTHA